MANDKRRHSRIPVGTLSMICRTPQGLLMNVATIRDLSEGGVGFYTRDIMAIGDEISFDFALQKNKGRNVNGSGHVVWAAPFKDVFGDTLVRCGVQFKNLPSTSMGTIRKFVNGNIKDSKAS